MKDSQGAENVINAGQTGHAQGSSRFSLAMSRLMSHTSIWLVWVAFLLLNIFIVPRFKALFKNFKMVLPALTVLFLSISDWIAAYSFLMPFLLLSIIAVDSLIVVLLSMEPSAGRGWFNHFVDRLWFVFMFCITFGAFGGSILAICMPMMQLSDALSK